MESVELALRNSNNRKEKALTGGDASNGGEDFSVDDLLDFSNGDGDGDGDDDDVFLEDEAELNVQRKRGASVSVNDDNTLRRSNDSFTAGEDFESLPPSELSVPMDDLAELEWLSNFVDDSLTPYSAPTKKPVWLTGGRRHRVEPVNEDSCFKAPLPPPPVLIRSKRARTRVSHWSLTDSSSCSTTSSSSSSGPSSPLWLSGAEILDESVVKRQQKKKMKKPLDASQLQTQTQTQTQAKRCSHCGVQKTPQWRAGPSGAKTLCNACGVRYKSGRLLPEYRPACSPTFSSELHSNHHRKVIEMRQKKEIPDDADETGLNPPVQTVQVVPSF